MIPTVLISADGTTLGATTFPGVPMVGQAVHLDGRYVIAAIEWQIEQNASMVLVLQAV
jgi:hypothetical protein